MEHLQLKNLHQNFHFRNFRVKKIRIGIDPTIFNHPTLLGQTLTFPNIRWLSRHKLSTASRAGHKMPLEILCAPEGPSWLLRHPSHRVWKAINFHPDPETYIYFWSDFDMYLKFEGEVWKTSLKFLIKIIELLKSFLWNFVMITPGRHRRTEPWPLSSDLDLF